MHKLRDSPGDAEEDLTARLGRIAGKGKVYVLGLGNVDRADDGAGVLVAKDLKESFPDYSFSEHDGVEGTVLDISERREDSVVFFVDASDMRLEPGAIKVIDRREIKETEISTHRVAVALMASLLERGGKRSAVIGIQPRKIEFRGEMSPRVMRAVDAVARALRSLMESNNR